MKVCIQTALFVIAFFGATVQPGNWALLGSGVAQAFHFPWDQGHDVFTPEEPPDDPEDCDKCNSQGSPFVVATGAYTISKQDIFIPGRSAETAIDLTRVYHGQDRHNGIFGRGWTFSYGVKLIEVSDGLNRTIIARRINGQRDRFVAQQDGSYTPPPDVLEILEKDASGFRLLSFDGIMQKFDVGGNLTSISDQNGNQILISYDILGSVSAVADSSGRVLRFIKGANGKVKTIVDPADRSYHYEYDQNGNLVSVTDPAGNVTRYAYDSRHRLTTITDPRGSVIASVTYDANDRVKTYSENGNTFVLTYSNQQKTVTERDQSGNTRILSYNDNINVTSIINTQGNSEIIQYNQMFLPSTITNESGNTNTIEYNSSGNVLSFIDAVDNRVTYTYDDIYQQLRSITDSRGNITNFEYNSVGDLVMETDALGNMTRHEYGTNGQLITTMDALGNISSFSYDSAGNQTQITDAFGKTANVDYDILGNTVSGIDAQGAKTTFEYDALNRLTGEKDALGNLARFEYDANGNLTGYVNRNGGRFAFEYDEFNRLISETDSLGRTTQFTYNSQGNLISRMDAKGQTITFKYDNLDRLIEKSSSSNITNFTYDSTGKLLSVADNDSRVQFTWDVVGRLESTVISGSGTVSDKVIRYKYDAAGNRTTMVDPSGNITTYEYDTLNRLIVITNSFGESYRYEYDALSRLIGREMANGARMDYTWDADGRVISIRDTVGNIVIQDEVYSYDNVGNRIRGDSSIHGVRIYEYDTVYRLLSVDHTDFSGLQDEFYSYDKIGNRLSSHASSQYTYDIGMQLIEDSAFRYTYDKNGNLIRKENKQTMDVTTYKWDTENQLIQVDMPNSVVVAFQYDGLGRRIAKSVNGQETRYIYDGHHLFQEYEEGLQVAQYTYGNRTDEPLSVRVGNQSYSYHTDSMRTIVALSDSTGNLVNSYQYDSFGGLITKSSGVKNTILFTGREWDPETELYYYRTRYYDPSLGRFISRNVHLRPDPFISGSESNNPRELVETEDAEFDIAVLERVLDENLAVPLRAPVVYAYAFNNPITIADPSGENPGLIRALAIAAKFIARYAKKGVKFCKKIRCKVELHPAHHKFGWPFNQKMKHVHAICYIKGKKGSAKRIQIPYAK